MDVGLFILVDEGEGDRVSFELTNDRLKRLQLAESCHLVSLRKHNHTQISTLSSTQLVTLVFLLRQLLKVRWDYFLWSTIRISVYPFGKLVRCHFTIIFIALLFIRISESYDCWERFDSKLFNQVFFTGFDLTKVKSIKMFFG